MNKSNTNTNEFIVTYDEAIPPDIMYPPDYNMVFYDEENNQIGKLDWNEGVLRFEGKAEESAMVFFDFLKGLVDSYIENN